MRFRLGLLIGLAAGYVLGARAGRQRYEQIMSTWRGVRRSEPAQQLTSEVRQVATRATHALEEKAAEGVQKVTQLARSRGHGEGNGGPGQG
jgi:hypothetical protein